VFLLQARCTRSFE